MIDLSKLIYLLDHVDFPLHSTRVNLHALPAGYYGLVLGYLQQLWEDDISLIADLSMDQNDGDITFEGSVRSYSHIKLNGL